MTGEGTLGTLATLRIGGPGSGSPGPGIAVDVVGLEEGALVLFLHGIGGARVNWHGQMRPLAALGWRAAAWDARGYGGSDDYDGPLHFADFSADLLRVLDHLGAAKACLVGLSMGGRIALDFQGRHPDRVGALVFADTSAGSPESRDPAKIELFLAARRRPLLEEGRTTADIAPGIARQLAGPTCPPAAMAAMVESLSALRTGSYLKTLDCVTRYHDFPPFAEITVPTLVVTGEHDPIAPPAMARRMAAEIPQASYAEIPEAGHISNLERPAPFNAVLTGFLARHWPARPS
ncbi:MAG: hypothetical protein RLY86_1103 [Pseudomonadota bacterium]|jgi:3-oxoadipate enol-lactonase